MKAGAMKEEKKIRKKIKIEDLLPRDPVRVDLDAILDYVQGKAVLVTGGGMRGVLYANDKVRAMDEKETDK